MKCPSGLPQYLCGQYEQLRAEVLDANQPARGQGLITLLSCGMADWIRSLESAYGRAGQACPAPVTGVTHTVSMEWVMILTGLVLGEAVQHG